MELKEQKKSRNKPHILFIGPILGSNPGFTPSPVEVLVPLLINRGYECLTTSSKTKRLQRVADMISCIIKNRKWTDIICLQVYAYRSFIVEDIVSWMGRHLNKKIIMVLHYGDFPHFLQIFPWWSRRVLQRANLIITPSAYLQEAIQKIGLSAKVIPNTILIKNYPYQHRENVKPRIIWMRSFFRYYNPNLALDAFKLVKAQYPEAKMMMAGSNKGLEQTTKDYAQKNGILNSVIFPGFLTLESKQKEFASSSEAQSIMDST